MEQEPQTPQTPEPQTHAQLLSFFKALSDPNRLRIVGLLANGPRPVEVLARELELGAPTTSHHLAKLAEAGLVSATPRGHHNLYALRLETLTSLAQGLLRTEELPRLADAGEDAFERKVLATFTDETGRLTAIPRQRKKFLVLVRHVAKAFEPGRTYPEPKVNAILKGYHEDTALLRRSLVDEGIMEREGGGGRYWLRSEG